MTTALPLEVLERPVLRADWLAALAELSRLRLVASDDTDRLSEGIRQCFDDERISPGTVEESVLFERSFGGATHLGAHGDLAEVFVRLRALIPERVLHDPQWRLFALVLVGYAFRAGVLSDADLSLASLLIVALPGARRDSESAATLRTPASQDRLAPLYWLLRDLFTPDELRIFVRLHVPGGEELDDELPSPTIGRANYTFEVFEGLHRRGAIDASLFDMLSLKRPGQAAAVARVRELTLDEGGGRP